MIKILAIVLVLIALLLVLLYAPTLRVMVVLSGGTKSAYYTFLHKLFTLERGKIMLLSDGTISVINKKSILLQKPIPKPVMIKFASFVWNAIKVKRLRVYISSNLNSMQDALVLGSTKVLGSVLDALVPFITRSEIEVVATKSRERGTVAVESKIKISIARALICYIKAKNEYKKELKEKSYAKAN